MLHQTAPGFCSLTTSVVSACWQEANPLPGEQSIGGYETSASSSLSNKFLPESRQGDVALHDQSLPQAGSWLHCPSPLSPQPAGSLQTPQPHPQALLTQAAKAKRGGQFLTWKSQGEWHCWLRAVSITLSLRTHTARLEPGGPRRQVKAHGRGSGPGECRVPTTEYPGQRVSLGARARPPSEWKQDREHACPP